MAETKVPYNFAAGASPEEEKRIVESVNDLIGAVGRQAFGSGILAEEDVVLPGRPIDLPAVSLPETISPLETYNRQQGNQAFDRKSEKAVYY